MTLNIHISIITYITLKHLRWSLYVVCVYMGGTYHTIYDHQSHVCGPTCEPQKHPHPSTTPRSPRTAMCCGGCSRNDSTCSTSPVAHSAGPRTRQPAQHTDTAIMRTRREPTQVLLQPLRQFVAKDFLIPIQALAHRI